jgi:surface antigen
VPIPTTEPGDTVTVTVPLCAKASAASPGAAQLAFWQIKNGSAVVPISGLTYSAWCPKVGTTGIGYPQDKLWASITINPTSGPMLPDLASPAYTTSNPYATENLGGQCTAFVWGRAYELGFNLTTLLGTPTLNAGQPWIDAANAAYQAGRLPSAPDMTPSANSIAVWSGHVAYVESVTTKVVSGNTIVTGGFLNEANCTSYKKFADNNDPEFPENTDQSGPPVWGGGYDGKTEPLSTVMNWLAAAHETFLGYIHRS